MDKELIKLMEEELMDIIFKLSKDIDWKLENKVLVIWYNSKIKTEDVV